MIAVRESKRAQVEAVSELVKAPVYTKQGKTILDVDRLEPKLAKQVGWLERRLYKHANTMGKSALMIGQILTQINTLLEPQKLFTIYLNRLWFSPATAYRFMEQYAEAEKKLPAVIVSKAISSGMPITSKRYAGAIALMPTPPKGEKEAESWLTDLRLKVREVLRKPKGETAMRFSMDTIASIVEKAYRKTVDAPPIDQWLRRLMEQVMLIHKEGRRAVPIQETIPPPSTPVYRGPERRTIH